MPSVTINRKRMYYAGRSLQRRPVLLLLHGAGGSHLDWPPQLRRVEEMGSCAVDLFGHGRSAKPGRSSVSDHADDVLELIDALGLTQIILVGHSMGGAVALEIALREPNAAIALVLVASGARLKVNRRLLDLVGANYEQAVEMITGLVWAQGVPADVVGRGQALMMQCDPTVVENDFAACNEFDVMQDLATLTIPTLVLTGTEDRLTPPKYGKYLADNIPDAEFVLIEGAGHMLAQERPEQVARHIIDFAGRRASPS